MFKPHMGICICHGLNRLIVVKKGYCKIGNDERKGKISVTKRGIPNGISKEKIYRPNRYYKTSAKHDGSTSRMDGTSRTKTSLVSKASDKTHANGRKDAQKARSPVKKKRKPIQYRKKATGELEVFKEVWQEAIETNPQGVVCACCPRWIGSEPNVSNFSHVLPKSTYPEFRLDKRNIWIVCGECHNTWEFGDRSLEKFSAKNAVATELREESNLLRKSNLIK